MLCDLTGVREQSESTVCFMWKSEHCTEWKGIVLRVNFRFAFVLHHTAVVM